jgi:hypothetical protein
MHDASFQPAGGNGLPNCLMHAAGSVRAERAERNLAAAWRHLSKPKNTGWLKH